jgi:hypothetical protein
MRRIKRDKPNSGRVGHAASHEASKDPARSEREPASDPGFATRPEANEPLNQRLDRIQDSIPYESQLNTRLSRPVLRLVPREDTLEAVLARWQASPASAMAKVILETHKAQASWWRDFQLHWLRLWSTFLPR